MKKILISVSSFWLLFFLSSLAVAQKQVSLTEGSMTWTTNSEQARNLTAIGMFHMMNAEREKAYHYFKEAIKNDPNFTIPLSVAAFLSSGEAKKELSKQTEASAIGKPEAERLFASFVEEGSTEEARRQTWAKLYALHGNDRVIGHLYAITRATPEERFAALTTYAQKYPEEPAVYNMLGYYYMNDKKDYPKAKEQFEKYIQLYPEGYNPYDSMGEFYLTTGDLANAAKYYNLSLEKYPFNCSALAALEKIKDQKNKTKKK